MLKKILAVILILAVAICFAACGKRTADPDQTSNTLSAEFSDLTGDSAASDLSASDLSASDLSVTDGSGASEIVLTTQPGQTMPTVATTAFVPGAASTQLSTMTPSTNFTVPGMTTPTVITSSLPYTYLTVNTGVASTQYTTRTTSSIFTTASTTSLIPTVTTTSATVSVPPTSTTAATRSSKSVVINDYATTSDKKLVVTIDPTGWDGKFQNNSQNITVKVDGVSKTAPCSIRSGAKNADGYQYITIDLSSVSVPDGATVQFTVPAAFLQTTSGAQYNSAFSGAYTMM